MASLPPNIKWLRKAADDDGGYLLEIGREKFVVHVERAERGGDDE